VVYYFAGYFQMTATKALTSRALGNFGNICAGCGAPDGPADPPARAATNDVLDEFFATGTLPRAGAETHGT
jgi:threonine synthase